MLRRLGAPARIYLSRPSDPWANTSECSALCSVTPPGASPFGSSDGCDILPTCNACKISRRHCAELHRSPSAIPAAGLPCRCRGQSVAFARWRNVGCLGQDQAGTCPLPMIGGHQLTRNITIRRASASHGRRDNAVLQRDSAANQLRLEKKSHSWEFTFQ